MTHPGCLISCLEVRLPFPSAFKQEKGFPPWVGEKKKIIKIFPLGGKTSWFPFRVTDSAFLKQFAIDLCVTLRVLFHFGCKHTLR